MVRPHSPVDVEAVEPAPPTSVALDDKHKAEYDDDEIDAESLDTWAPEKQAAYWESGSPLPTFFPGQRSGLTELFSPSLTDKWGFVGRVMALAVRKGCEARGIQPIGLEVRPSTTFPPTPQFADRQSSLVRTDTRSPGSRT